MTSREEESGKKNAEIAGGHTLVEIKPIEYEGFAAEAFAKWVVDTRRRIENEMRRYNERAAEAAQSGEDPQANAA